MVTTREQIAEFHTTFGIPVEQVLLESPSIELRVLRAKLLLEEVVETITQGLGLKVYVNAIPPSALTEEYGDDPNEIEIIDVGAPYDPIETFDGLGDVNVVIHGTAHCLGGNLDRVTSEIHRSNMSKLDEDGKPIINECKHYGGDKMPTLMMGVEAIPETTAQCKNRMLHNSCDDPTHLIDPTKPIGKILKSPNFEAPNLGPILAAGNWPDLPVPHIDESTIAPSAALDHCAEHPDQTSENCEGGYGLAGGGVGAYYICGVCGSVFGKTDDGEEA